MKEKKMKILKQIFLISSILILTIAQSQAAVKVGEQAPDFTLTDSNGQTHSLSEYTGKYVVLEWVNYECPFVIKHYGSDNMQTLQKQLTQDGVVWLSINSSAEGKQGHFSPAEVNQKMQERGAKPTAYLLDSDGKIGKEYGAKTTPHMFVIDPDQKLVYQGAIDDNPSFDPKDIPNSKNYVLAAMNDIKAGKAVGESSTKSYGCSVKY